MNLKNRLKEFNKLSKFLVALKIFIKIDIVRCFGSILDPITLRFIRADMLLDTGKCKALEKYST